MGLEERLQTAQAYENSAEERMQYYTEVRPDGRIEDVKKAFSYIGKENPRVVELGCGHGREVAAILERTVHYIGIDISRSMINMAQAANPTARFGVSDVVGYEFPIEKTDIIFAFASLLHLERDEVRLTLAKAHEALNDGGIIYISLKQGDYQKFPKQNEYGTRWFYLYQPKDIQELAGEGFETVHLDEQIVNNVPWFTIVLKKQ